MAIEGDLIRALGARSVRFVAIGVWAVNQYAQDIREAFSTKDKDLFLPLDPENLVRAWAACESVGLDLWAGEEPLDQPHDLVIARAVVELRALTRAVDGKNLFVDLTLVMAGFDFDTAWDQRRIFQLDGATLPVARLEHIVTSKATAGRAKDRLFLETHAQVLGELKRRDEALRRRKKNGGSDMPDFPSTP